MARYYFDLRDGNVVMPDDDGLDLPDIDAVQVEAARSLADMVRDAVHCRPLHSYAIEVRDDNGPVLEATINWRIRRTNA